jgi:hypothetical protein
MCRKLKKSNVTQRTMGELALLVALSGCAHLPPAMPFAANGIILSPEQAHACIDPGAGYYYADGHFTRNIFTNGVTMAPVSTANVRRIEASLVTGLQLFKRPVKDDAAGEIIGRLTTDVRRYVGTSDGHILIFGTSVADHSDCPPMVMDGWADYWYLRFDITTGSFDRFLTNDAP